MIATSPSKQEIAGLFTAASSAPHRELLPDSIRRDPVGVLARRHVQPFDRLEQRLAAQLEGLVVYREYKLGAGIVGHTPCLLRGAMRTDPGIVCADWHYRQVEGLRPTHVPEDGGHRRIAAEQDTVAAAFDGVSVVCA